ncbi:hypothetical protein [Owenweeksia hongkongensis]|uniref:hypothetical protein n=1 Tax=Owenweeksia hongkongensis TaxID=253245 RepID=UPI003A9005F9
MGEKFTSDLTTRKFANEDLRTLNPNIDFSCVEYIYQIGSCNGQDIHVEHLIKLLRAGLLRQISGIRSIDFGRDDLGEAPIGKYALTYLFKMKNGHSFVQVVVGSFERKGREIRYEESIKEADVRALDTRKLIFPV